MHAVKPVVQHSQHIPWIAVQLAHVFDQLIYNRWRHGLVWYAAGHEQWVSKR